ncbi:MAG: acyl--CoA ligase [Butyrivibrio sp.]|nr:acyl--CoA ligase [Butyrivibrio sp.]
MRMFNSIIEAVAKYAKEMPNKFCVIDHNGAHTYEEIWELTQAAMWQMKKLGIKKRDCIMVECTQDALFLVCDLACELCGAIFVPIEHKASEERVKIIAEDTDARLFICNTEYDISVKMMSINLFFIEKSNKIETAIIFPQKESTAEILYTTGTTGIAKGVEITNGNNIALAENVKYGTEMKKNNIELIPLPLSHSHGLRCCYANMLNGSTVVLVEGVSRVKYVFDLIMQYGVTAIDASPSAILILNKLSKGKFGEISRQIDYIQVGTEVLSEDVKELLILNFPTARLYNFYGSTESGRTCVLNFNKERGKKGCIGRPTRNAKFIVTDEERREIRSSRDNVGLLASAGLMNMRGYWRQDKLTQQIVGEGYVYTNDIGYIDEEGYIYVIGRKDDVINYKGIKIAPEEIEEKARKYEGIVDCACIPQADSISGQVPKLFIVVRNKEKFQIKKFFSFLEKYIDENKMPKGIEIIDEIPRTYNGKIHRMKLINREGDAVKNT